MVKKGKAKAKATPADAQAAQPTTSPKVSPKASPQPSPKLAAQPSPAVKVQTSPKLAASAPPKTNVVSTAKASPKAKPKATPVNNLKMTVYEPKSNVSEEELKDVTAKAIAEIEKLLPQAATPGPLNCPKSWAKEFRPILGPFRRFLDKCPRFVVVPGNIPSHFGFRLNDGAPATTLPAWKSFLQQAYQRYLSDTPKEKRDVKVFVAGAEEVTKFAAVGVPKAAPNAKAEAKPKAAAEEDGKAAAKAGAKAKGKKRQATGTEGGTTKAVKTE